ncbi:MAG: 3-dehydroquinate synthase [Rhodobacteraceae bacterium]|nr:3-dehydroquinate synthase [Paracoccaceae bacterium]
MDSPPESPADATRTVRVDLGGRAYDIHIGAGVLGRAGAFLAQISPGRCAKIITEANVAALHLDALRRALAAAGVKSDALVLPAGEATKTWPYLQQTAEWLLEQRVERGDMVVALGGGVIGDLAGFAAAIVRRGVGLVQIPTSLLAQVDSSVGGKTGINTAQGKNLVGAFYQPALVLADTDMLETLGRRDLLAGYGEMVKYGLLRDADFFAWLETHGLAVLGGDSAARIAAITRCCAMKAAIVGRDETEAGERALLNLGHTFAHALEAATGFSPRLLHGEAVAIGCVLAFEMSARLGLCAAQEPKRIRAHFQSVGMKADLTDIAGDLPDAAAIVALMEQDKKVRGGQLRFIVARGVGQAFVSADVPRDAVCAVLQGALAAR